MKKLITVIAAAVMGFAYGDGLKNTIGFEDAAYSTGDALDTNKDDSKGDSSKFWYAGAEGLGTFAEYGEATPYNYGSQPVLVTDGPGDRYLALDSGSTVLYRTIIENAGTLPEGTDIGTDGLFFDSLVKFTVTEYDPTAAITVDEGTKLAVWLGQAESDEGDAPTNLIVTAAIWDAAQEKYVATNFVATTTVDITDGAWHRITARAIKDVATATSAFTLFIDGTAVTYDADNLFDPSVKLTGEPAKLLGEGKLFINIMSGLESCSSLAGFGFKGTGSIDDVSITDKDNAPAFAKGARILNVTLGENVTSVTVGTKTITETGTIEDPVAGADVTAEVANGFLAKFVGPVTDGKLDDDFDDKTLMVTAAAVAYTIGDDKYATFAEALTAAIAAGAPTTIKLAGNVDGWTECQTIADANADVTLDLNGKTLTFSDDTIDYLVVVNYGSFTVIDSAGEGKIDATGADVLDGMFYASADETEEGSGVFYDGKVYIGLDDGDEGATFDGVLGDVTHIKKGWFDKANNGEEAFDYAELLPETGYQVVSDGDYWKVCAAEPVGETFSVTAAPAAENSTLTVQTNGVDLVGVENVYTANAGDTIVVTYTADEGFEFDGKATVTKSFTEDDDTTFATAPVPTAAKPFKGAGTEADPFQIWTVADLQKLDELVDGGETFAGKYFEQQANIDMTGVTWGGIGTVGGTGKAFSGVYDGAGFAITGLTTTNTGNYCGILFNNVDNGVIKNLIAAATVDASGGFSMFGGASASVFSNVTVRGSIVGTHHCGGFTSFGQWSDGASTYIDCVNEAAVASSKSAGGFCGRPQTDAIFIRCVNKGTIGAEGKMGGDPSLAGFCSGGYGQFTDCVNEGVVLGTYGQFSDKPVSVAGTMVARDDQLAATGAFDGINFATVAGDVATLISNDQVVVGGTYKVMSPIATLPITLDTVDQTIAFDVALNTAFVADITATGVGVTTNLVENLLTYTAIEAPTPSEDWPTDPTVDEGKDAKETFPNLPDAFEGADAGLVAAWAKNPAKGNLAYADMANANIEAFLLDCAAVDVETEKAKFKITKIEYVEGEWVVTVADEFGEGERYGNGEVEIEDVTKTLDPEATGATDTKGFYQAKLVPFIEDVE